MTEKANIPNSPGALSLSEVSSASFYIDLYLASPTDRIGMIKAGINAIDAKRIVAELSVPQVTAFKALKLSIATVNRKAARDEALPQEEGERVLGMAKMIGQLQTMIAESGNPEGFDAADWISRWFETPVLALGGRRPVDLLDTMEGQALVSDTLARMQSGAYA